MKKSTRKLKICSRGHGYYKSSDCPVCPKCWPGYYKTHGSRDFDTLGAPAQRALLNAKITKLSHLAKYSEDEILEFHGIGSSSLPKLRKVLKVKGLSFKK
jgi:hypothetical protein